MRHWMVWQCCLELGCGRLYSIVKSEESMAETTLEDGKAKKSLFNKILNHWEGLQLLQWPTSNFLAISVTLLLKLCLPDPALIVS